MSKEQAAAIVNKGLEHPQIESAFVTISKKRNRARNTAIASGIGLGGSGAAIAGGVQGKKGKKWSTAWRAGGRSWAEGAGGFVAGSALGGLAGGPAGRTVGGAVGLVGGSTHGGYASFRNSQRKGWVKSD